MTLRILITSDTKINKINFNISKIIFTLLAHFKRLKNDRTDRLQTYILSKFVFGLL